MKVLLTGGSGMVGKNILESIKALKYEMLYPSRENLNLLDYAEVLAYCKKNQPQVIIHAAGTVGGIQANIKNPAIFLYENMQVGFNIIKAAQESGIKRFINLGSSCMYPKLAENPLRENMLLTGSLEPTNEGYAIAKIACAKLCEYIDSHKGFSYKTLIPCNLYGSYDSFDPAKSHMIPSVIRKLHDAKTSKLNSVMIWGDGTARREFMLASDLADIIMDAVGCIDELPSIFNVGIGLDYSIQEYYSEIAEVVGYEGMFEYDLTKPTGMKQKLVDISKLESLGWRARTSLKDGLKITYKYYLDEVLK